MISTRSVHSEDTRNVLHSNNADQVADDDCQYGEQGALLLAAISGQGQSLEQGAHEVADRRHQGCRPSPREVHRSRPGGAVAAAVHVLVREEGSLRHVPGRAASTLHETVRTMLRTVRHSFPVLSVTFVEELGDMCGALTLPFPNSTARMPRR